MYSRYQSCKLKPYSLTNMADWALTGMNKNESAALNKGTYYTGQKWADNLANVRSDSTGLCQSKNGIQLHGHDQEHVLLMATLDFQCHCEPFI